MLYFVGAGLISGAVVHHPLDPARYTKIAVVGVLVFLVATLVNEFLLAAERPALPRAILVIAASLLLSFGIGMLSGGLQHFEDFPARGAVLVPLGIDIGLLHRVHAQGPPVLLATHLRPPGAGRLPHRDRRLLRPAYDRGGAGRISGESGHSHSGGAEEEAEEHETGEEPSAPSSESATAETTPSTDAESGHASDGHSH